MVDEVPEGSVITYGDVLVAAFGRERYEEAMRRDYGNIVMVHSPVDGPPDSMYGCADGKCVLAVVAGTTDPFPDELDVATEAVAGLGLATVIGIYLGNQEVDTDHSECVQYLAKVMMKRIIEMNDAGILRDRGLREAMMATALPFGVPDDLAHEIRRRVGKEPIGQATLPVEV